METNRQYLTFISFASVPLGSKPGILTEVRSSSTESHHICVNANALFAWVIPVDWDAVL